MKDKKRVLIVAYLFPPIGGIGVQRALKFAKYLSDYGWSPIILTTKDAAIQTMDASLLDEIPDHVKVIRVGDPVARLMKRAMRTPAHHISSTAGADTLADSNRSGLGRLKQWLKGIKDRCLIPDEHIIWAIRAALVASRLVHRGNVSCVFTTSSPLSSHAVGWLLKRWTNIPWIADFRDPWTDNMHFRRTGLRAALERTMERSVLQSATAITTVTESFATQFSSKHPSIPAKITVIRNGVDPADFPTNIPAPKSGKFTMLYAGILYPKRSPEPFLKALSIAIRKGRIHADQIKVEFAGVFDYASSTTNRMLVEQLHLEKVVKVLGYLTHDEVLQRMSSAHSLLLIGDKDPRAHMYIPGKLYEYLYVQRPIFGILQLGEASSLIEHFEAGVVLTPTDIDGIEEALVHYVHKFYNEGYRMKERPIPNVVTRRYQTLQLAQLLDEVSSERRRHGDARTASLSTVVQSSIQKHPL